MHGDTSWETSASWYDKIVGVKGHYYHEHVILPGLLRLIGAEKDLQLLDLACGQGVLSRHLPKGASYVGIDGSTSLIAAAKKQATSKSHQFLVHDLMQPLTLTNKNFSHVTCVLALQNLSEPLPLFQIAHAHLRKQGLFLMVLNHPYFRIPRQSSWGVDVQKKLQYRRVDRYMTPLKVPIQTHPGQQGASEQTWSFHFPLSYYTAQLKKVGFVLTEIQEWCSDKKSSGKTATMENRSRQEFPLFMTLVAKKA